MPEIKGIRSVISFFCGLALVLGLFACSQMHQQSPDSTAIVLIKETETQSPTETHFPPTPTNPPPTPTHTLIPPSDTPTPLPPTSTPAPSKTPGPRTKRHNGVNALVIVPDPYGANYHLMKDSFEWFGWQVTTTGVNTFSQPCAVFAGPNGCKNVKVDVLISDITEISQFDVLAIMPSTLYPSVGEPYQDLLDSEPTLSLIRSAADDGLVIYAPCTGVRVLAAAGVIDGNNVTGHGAYEQEYLEAGAIYLRAPHPPVIDQNMVTSVRNLYYHVQTGEAWTTSLENLEILFADDALNVDGSSSTSTPYEDAVWTTTIGGQYADGGRSVQETSDGGFIIAGYTYSLGAGNSDGYLVKVDSEGALLWEKTFGWEGWEYLNSVNQTSDGGFILTGYTSSQGAGSKDLLLIKTDPLGNQLWSNTFGGPGVDVGLSVVEIKGGDYVAVGFSESFGAGESDVYLVRTDSKGVERWTKTFGEAGPERGASIDITKDGGLIIAGSSGSYSDSSDIYLLKTNSEGIEAWSKTITFAEAHLGYDWGTVIKETSDGGFIITGNRDMDPDVMDILAVKTDANGNLIWTEFFGKKFYDYGSSVIETRDGSFVISGATKNASTGLNKIYLRKIDTQGQEIWTQTLGTAKGSEWGSAVIETSDGNLVIVGHTNSFGAGSYDIWLVKLDPQTLGTD